MRSERPRIGSDYYRLGRVFPRSRVREPFSLRGRKRGWLYRLITQEPIGPGDGQCVYAVPQALDRVAAEVTALTSVGAVPTGINEVISEVECR